MVRPLQTWLAQIRLGLGAVALAAGRDASGRAEVMAGLAVGAHLGHAGMRFVIEIHGQVYVSDLVQHNTVRAFAEIVCARLVN